MAQSQTIARPYAKAAFELAQNEDNIDNWQFFLSASALFISEPSVLSHLVAPGFFVQLTNWLDEFLVGKRDSGLNEKERNFLKILEENDRLTVLPQISQAFDELQYQQKKICVVRVQSAEKLNVKHEQLLKWAMARKLGREVRIESSENPALIAGVIIEYEGQVIDQSIGGRLADFARALD